jgi:hypothetical protein
MDARHHHRGSNDHELLVHADDDLIRTKAAKLCRHPLFRRSEQPDIEQNLRIYIWVKSRLFDPSRGTPEAFAAMACDSWACQEIRRRSRQKRVGDYTALPLDGTFLDCDGDLLSLDRVLTAADLDHRHQRQPPSSTSTGGTPSIAPWSSSAPACSRSSGASQQSAARRPPAR